MPTLVGWGVRSIIVLRRCYYVSWFCVGGGRKRNSPFADMGGGPFYGFEYLCTLVCSSNGKVDRLPDIEGDYEFTHRNLHNYVAGVGSL